MKTLLTSLIAALGLMLIIEGMMPFISPQKWKEIFKQIIELPDAQIRVVGLASMIAGLVVLWLVL